MGGAIPRSPQAVRSHPSEWRQLCSYHVAPWGSSCGRITWIARHAAARPEGKMVTNCLPSSQGWEEQWLSSRGTRPSLQTASRPCCREAAMQLRSLDPRTSSEAVSSNVVAGSDSALWELAPGKRFRRWGHWGLPPARPGVCSLRRCECERVVWKVTLTRQALALKATAKPGLACEHAANRKSK